MLEQEIATAALRDQKYFNSLIKKIIASREKLTKALKKFRLLGFTKPYKLFYSKTSSKYNHRRLVFKIKAEEIYIQYFKDEFCKDYIRITVGTELENKI